MQNSARFDLISIGDSTIDVFLELDPSEVDAVCTLDPEECLICFEYASKIPVRQLTRVAAVGNAANNAIGSARLGLETAIYTVIGSDKDSQEIKEAFEQEGIDTSFLVMESGKRSNFSSVINYSGERTIFVYHEDRTYDASSLPSSKWAYYTSVAKGHEVLHRQIPEWIKKNNIKLGFNPGSYQLREGLEALKPVLEVTEVLLLNRDEAHGLVGGDAQDTKGLINKLRETGPKIVVISDGRNGSFASFDGREFWHCGIPEESPVLERTGAGDAYSTGFLAALIRGEDLPTAMIWGTMNATSVVQYIGAREGLLTPEGMQKFIAQYGGEVKPKII